MGSYGETMVNYGATAAMFLVIVQCSVFFIFVGGIIALITKNKILTTIWRIVFNLFPIICAAYSVTKTMGAYHVYSIDDLNMLGEQETFNAIFATIFVTVPVLIITSIPVKIINRIIANCKKNDKRGSDKKYDNRPQKADRTPLSKEQQNDLKERIIQRTDKAGRAMVQKVIQRSEEDLSAYSTAPQALNFEKSVLKQVQPKVSQPQKPKVQTQPVQKSVDKQVQKQAPKIKLSGKTMRCEFCNAVIPVESTHCSECWAPVFKI